MSDVTHILSQIETGDQAVTAQLFPLVYEELRKLAAVRLAQEKPGQTLQATALVHEAYLRLVGDQQFDSRGHFFAAAAEVMRRILVNHARRERDRPEDSDGNGFHGVKPTLESRRNLLDHFTFWCCISLTCRLEKSASCGTSRFG